MHQTPKTKQKEDEYEYSYTPWLHHRPKLFDGVIRVIFTQYTSIVNLSTATANREYRPSAMLSTQDTRHKTQGAAQKQKRWLRRFDKEAPRAPLRLAASLVVLCLFFLYLFV